MKQQIVIALLVLTALFATSVAAAQEEYGHITLYARDIYGAPINGATMGYWSESDQSWYDFRSENHSESWIEMRDPKNVTRIRASAEGYFTMELKIPIPSVQPDVYDMYTLHLVPLGYVPPPPMVPGFPWDCWLQ